MAFVFPFITDKFTAYADAKEMTSTKLSLAVLVRDGINDQLITTGLKVFLQGDKSCQPVQNLSGYYCFNNVSPGKYRLIIKSNNIKEEQFFNSDELIDIPLKGDGIGELNPVREIKLSPKPSYLFSANATLIRGTVSRKPEGVNPVINATVIPRYQGEQEDPSKIISTRTDGSGEFVLILKKIEFENSNTKKDIKNIIIDIDDRDGNSISIKTMDLLKNKTLLEGETGVIVIDNFPDN